MMERNGLLSLLCLCGGFLFVFLVWREHFVLDNENTHTHTYTHTLALSLSQCVLFVLALKTWCFPPLHKAEVNTEQNYGNAQLRARFLCTEDGGMEEVQMEGL